jgi:two-component system, OmpR family, phosphate regulon sensor histidine kinase PhoR
MASILIIDNEHPIRKDIYDFLKRDGYTIQTTNNGAEGVQLAITNDFEFVMIEQELSDNNGIKILQSIKRVKPEIVCFIIANEPSFEVAVESANLGACSYIPKPLSYEGLSFHLSKGVKHRQLFIEARKLRKERYNNLQELSLEKSMFKTVLNAINGGVLVINTDGELVYFNNASLVNLNLENLEPGEQILPKLPQQIIKQVSEYLLVKKRTSKVSEIELEIIPKNKLYIQSVCSHIPRGSDKFSGVVLITRNITEKRKLEQVKSQFVSMVAHELKSPLVAVEGFLQILQNDEIKITDDKKKEFIQRSYERIKSLFQLVNDLLDISKIEQREKYRELEEVNLAEIIQSTINLFEIESKNKNLEVKVEAEESLPLIKVEKEEIARLVGNLFSNAIKYNKQNGSIIIKLSSDENYLNFSISDNGIGIRNDDKHKLFQEFFRALNKQTRAVSGTGLGLTISKRIVESYHGKINFESEYGVGTKFFVKLPIIKN